MSPKPLLAASTLAWALASPLAAQQAPHRLHLFDVRAALGADAPDPAYVDLRLPVTASHIDRVYLNEAPPFAQEHPFHLQLEDGLALVRTAIAADPGAVADRVEALPGRILVAGNEAAHAAAARAVRTLHAATAPRVEVDVLRVPKGALVDAPSSVLDAEEAEALFAAHAAAPRATATAAFGRSEFIGSPSWTAHVHDFDVEVAQGAFAADPTITRVPTGRTLGVRVDPAADGALLVRAWGQQSALTGPPRTISIPGIGRNAIDLPEVATSIFTSSAKVPDGGALCVDTDGGDVVVVRTRDTLEGAPDGVLRLGALAGPALVVRPIWLSPIEPSRGLEPPEDPLFEHYTHRWFDCGLVGVEFVDALLGRGDVASDAVFLGTQALGVWDATARAALQNAASELEAAVASPSFVFAFGAVPDDQVGALLSDAARLTGFADTAERRMSGAALDGDWLQLLAGTERAYIQDYDTQIAAGSTIPDPIVKAVFDGVRVWCAPLGREGDRVRVLVDVRAQQSRFDDSVRTIHGYVPRAHDGDEGEALATGTFDAELPVELGSTRAQGTRSLLTLEPGVWHAACVQEVAGTGQTFVAAVRCTLEPR